MENPHRGHGETTWRRSLGRIDAGGRLATLQISSAVTNNRILEGKSNIASSMSFCIGGLEPFARASELCLTELPLPLSLPSTKIPCRQEAGLPIGSAKVTR